MFDKKIIIVTPWFGRFAGGAELLARGMARELIRRGVPARVLTTCSASPYDSWWEDHYQPGEYCAEGIDIKRFATKKGRGRYDAVISKLRRDSILTEGDQQDFFDYGINSPDLIGALAEYLNSEYEVLALPYFHGLTHSVINRYPGKISLVPCFHDEPQFYWSTTEKLLRNARLIFYNSVEEKRMTIRQYGQKIGRRIVEGVVTGVGVESPLTAKDQHELPPHRLPDNYFVYAGRKEVGKNVPVLCQWFTNYVENFHQDTKLVFLGGGDKTLVPPTDQFIDLGFVSEGTKQQILARSKGVLTLSENESFSLVIMEGWLSGVPAVVSARCAVTTDHVRKCNGGLYVANADEFGLALKYLQENDSVRNALAANGREYVFREYSFDKVLGRYLREFRRCRESEKLFVTAC